jgi:antitoxin HicB
VSVLSYPATFSTGGDGRVLVEFLDLPSVAADALGSDLSIRLSRKEDIPSPSRAKRGQRLVPVPLWLAPKLALYVAMRDREITNTSLARQLGVHEKVVRRMLDPGHATKPARIQAALAALGKHLAVEIRDAA